MSASVWNHLSLILTLQSKCPVYCESEGLKNCVNFCWSFSINPMLHCISLAGQLCCNTIHFKILSTHANNIRLATDQHPELCTFILSCYTAVTSLLLNHILVNVLFQSLARSNLATHCENMALCETRTQSWATCVRVALL